MKKKISKQKLLNIILKVLVIGIVLVVGNNTVFAQFPIIAKLLLLLLLFDT